MSYQKAATRIILLHWLALPLLLLSLLTGLRIHLSNRDAGSLAAWADQLPSGDIYALHLLAACGWVGLACVYGLHLAQRRRRARLEPQLSPHLRERFNYWLICLGQWLLAALLFCGALLYFRGSALFDGGALLLHRFLAYALPAYLLVHGLAQLLWGHWPRVRRIVFGRLSIPALLQAAIVIPVVAGLALWALRTPLHNSSVPSLPVITIGSEDEIEIDGKALEPQWQFAPIVEVDTTSIGGEGSAIPVRIQALKQGEVAYFLFSWPDASPSYMHLPLVKTAEGWKVMQDGSDRYDEKTWYEDKFAVMLSRTSEAGGAGTANHGRRPLAAYPASTTGRGYHYTNDGEVLVDVWQWKAVRTHGLTQLDDSHFGAPYPSVPGETRYTGGYKADPLQAGGYTENWAWFSTATVIPKRLPKDPAQLAAFQSDKSGSVWGLNWYETEPYDPAKDKFPIGTRMPSVLWKGVFEGDRGHVRAQASWRNGRWMLEVARGLKTNSAFDLDIQEGLFLWVSVFDHAQTRHSYHLRPLRLRFE